MRDNKKKVKARWDRMRWKRLQRLQAPCKYLRTYKSSINNLKCSLSSNKFVFCIFFSTVRGFGSCDKMRCFSSRWFSCTADSVVHFLSACPKSVYGMFVPDHVDQADIEKCTTGSENSTYSIWEMRGIQGSSGESAAIFFFVVVVASGQFEFTPGMERRNSFLQ